MIKQLAASVVVTFILAGVAMAGPLTLDQTEHLFGDAPIDVASAADEEGDYSTALKLYRQLADQGVAVAQNNLGFMYENGNGVPMDFAEAASWYGRSAAQGDNHAQWRLCQMYSEGKGVPRDYIRAYKWCDIAAVLQPQTYRCPGKSIIRCQMDASMGMGFAKDRRDDIAAEITPSQLAEAQRMAREWKPKPER